MAIGDVPPFEFLQIVKESAYGTLMGSPVAGTDSHYIRLDGANRFTMRPQRIMRTVDWGGGFAIGGYKVSDQMRTEGKLDLTLCYSQAKLILDWAVTKINSGQTTPWTTTEQPGDLASCSIFHGIMKSDGSVKRKRYAGVKVHSGSLTSGVDTGLVALSLQLMALKPIGNTIEATADPDATAFPSPADTVFPTDPLLYVQIGGGVSVNGSTLAFLQSATMNWTNVMDPQWYAGTTLYGSYFPSFDKLRGRNSTMECRVLYTASPDWRAVYEAVTTMAASVTFTNGTRSVLMNYNANNVMDPQPNDDLVPGKVYNQTFTLVGMHDVAASDDITFTFT